MIAPIVFLILSIILSIYSTIKKNINNLFFYLLVDVSVLIYAISVCPDDTVIMPAIIAVVAIDLFCIVFSFLRKEK